MTFPVQVPAQPIQLNTGVVKFELHDNSGAHVDMTLAVQGQQPTTFHFNHSGPGDATKSMTLKAGTYRCVLIISVFTYQTFSRNYACSAEVNGVRVAQASGNLPAVPGFDNGTAEFTIVVP